MEKTALLIIDAQQEYFAPMVLFLADATAAMDLKALDGTLIPHDQVHRTHLASLNGFLATVTTSDRLMAD
jgi:hypothetical protein